MMSLKSERKKRGLSQKELATLLEISYATICRYESGTLPIPKKRLEQIASVLDTDITSLQDSDTSSNEVESTSSIKKHLERIRVFLIGLSNGRCDLCNSSGYPDSDGIPILCLHNLDVNASDKEDFSMYSILCPSCNAWIASGAACDPAIISFLQFKSAARSSSYVTSEVTIPSKDDLILPDK